MRLKKLKKMEMYNMAIKILTKGNLPTFTGKCPICDCRVETNYGDFATYRSEKNEIWMVIDCPTDGCKTKFSCYKLIKYE